jgi:hypothetical protein
MTTYLTSEHPKQQLLFYVVSDVGEAARDGVRRAVEALATTRSWVLAPPRFVDSCDPAPEGSGDADIETVGGRLEIYSAQPAASLPKEVDLAHLEEVEAVVEALRLLSKQQGLSFEFELDGTYVGGIENGELNKVLREGLLSEWRKHLTGVVP